MKYLALCGLLILRDWALKAITSGVSQYDGYKKVSILHYLLWMCINCHSATGEPGTMRLEAQVVGQSLWNEKQMR